jgi:hypothetical protein
MDGLPGVHADPDAQIAFGHRPLHGDGTRQRRHRTGE